MKFICGHFYNCFHKSVFTFQASKIYISSFLFAILNYLFYSRKPIIRIYGTSSKQSDDALNSRINWFSIWKNTTVLPAFWKSVQVSSSVINHLVSSIKKSLPIQNSPASSVETKPVAVDEKPICDSKDLQFVRFETTNSAHTNDSKKNLPTVTKKEAKDASVLEQAFSDWISLDKDHGKTMLEKREKPVTAVKKATISRVRNFFIVNIFAHNFSIMQNDHN